MGEGKTKDGGFSLESRKNGQTLFHTPQPPCLECIHRRKIEQSTTNCHLGCHLPQQQELRVRTWWTTAGSLTQNGSIPGDVWCLRRVWEAARSVTVSGDVLWVTMLRLLIAASMLRPSPLVALSNAHFSSTSSQQRHTFALVLNVQVIEGGNGEARESMVLAK